MKKRAWELTPLHDRIWLPERRSIPSDVIILPQKFPHLYSATVLSKIYIASTALLAIRTISGTVNVDREFWFHLDTSEAIATDLILNRPSSQKHNGRWSIE